MKNAIKKCRSEKFYHLRGPTVLIVTLADSGETPKRDMPKSERKGMSEKIEYIKSEIVTRNFRSEAVSQKDVACSEISVGKEVSTLALFSVGPLSVSLSLSLSLLSIEEIYAAVKSNRSI